MATPALSPGTAPEQPVPVRVMSRGHLGLLVVVLIVLFAGTCALVFGPGRGARHDIRHMTGDLDASRNGIFEQLRVARTQLAGAERSLVIQEHGLEVAKAAEGDSRTAAQATQQILVQTQEARRLVREVAQALGPLDELGPKIDSVVRNVGQGVRLAETALRVAEQTLGTGQRALAVAQDTLATLKRSEQIQVALLKTARATLQQTIEINRKIPGLPVFPTTSPSARSSAGTAAP